MAASLKRLPDAELTVMQAVWRLDAPVRRADIERTLSNIHPMAPTTLLTLLARLAAKDFLRIEKEGRGSVYIPLVSESEYRTVQSRSFFSRLFGGNVSAFANALTEGGLSREELEELKRLLEENDR
ncbi:MAG: BlaI/MecI/CopY family transcriptional regulator [Clostridia bacterium]|nr:BlaI/MecI/CopY family transcriptional regulator [Clostridia bacterium]